MPHDIAMLVFLALCIAIGVTGYEMNAATKPHYRKGCGECTADARRVMEAYEERQRELVHDFDHRRGFPGGDRFNCNDDNCPRNHR